LRQSVGTGASIAPRRIDAHLDQFEQSPPQGWPLWCARQILDSNYVLPVCTKSCRERFLSLEKFGAGRSVK